MFDFIFDPATNGIVLQESEKPLRREPRPVYTEEHVLRAKIDEFRDDGCALFR